MLRTGAVLLSVWSGLNLILCVACLLAITIFKQNAPGVTLMVDESAIRQLDPKWLAGINGLAALGNTLGAAFCILVLFVTWTSLVKKARWAFWGLLFALGFLQVFTFVSYSVMGVMNLPPNIVTMYLLANIVSAAVLAVGLGLSGYAIYRQP